jgi:hypothetical protein
MSSRLAGRRLQVEGPPEVITPLTPIDLATATDQEIIDAYLADGEDEQGARAYLAVIRGNVPVGTSVE